MTRTILLCLLALVSESAFSHPLGIFSVNRYARIELAGRKLSVRYVMDMAEVPSIHEIETIDLDHDGVFSENERRQYADRKIEEAYSRADRSWKR